ncbi:M20/M25/M40 family metallo-hydrolase [Mesorhizobium sp. M0040]|uniref:M20/M25/M40 family metallo-hydrolase n=1 Tax=Mesorhizobium sp. M0040 TaxID=2956855 RepID=UPI00333CDD91
MSLEENTDVEVSRGAPRQLVEKVLRHADANLSASLDRLFQFLRIPSISCDTSYAPQCREAASWISDELSGIGFDASVRSTIGNPMVVAHNKEANGPHVLFYGHYDVQPVEPLDAWKSDPFEPSLEEQPDGETHIVARGASDDKGQLLTFIEACRSWKAVTGHLPLSVSMLFEGEEENDSKSMESFLDEAGDELTADVMLLCDTYLWGDTVPAIVVTFRGVLEDTIEISCASRDLHPGHYSNAARNPIQVLAELIASLRGANGEVAIEGFYDDIARVDDKLRANMAELDFDAGAYLSNVGLSQSAGETAYSVLEQIWMRPACEIYGIAGGHYDGHGFKCSIPSTALAKIAFRLVPGQDPQRIRAAFRNHIRARTPVDCRLKFSDDDATYPPAVISYESPYLDSALVALKQEWNLEPVLIGSGGSIPIIHTIKRRLGLDSLPIGFARSNNGHHSANEKYDLSSFHKGIRSWIRILAELAQRANDRPLTAA